MRAMTWQLWVTLGAIALVCLLWLVAAGGLLWAVLDTEDFQTMVTAMNGRWGLLLFLWAISLVPIYSALQWAMNRYLAEPERLADAIDLRRKQHIDQPIDPVGIPQIDRLASLFNALLAHQKASSEQVDERIHQAVAATEEERAWLSALLSELNRSVIVCNRDGQILLYNNRARLQFKRLSEAGHMTHGGELIGLGRSIYAAIDRSLLEHAKEMIERRLAKGQRHTSTQCLMQTPTGRTYRIHVTPVCRHVFVQTQKIDGMILVIENITDEVNAKQQHIQNLKNLVYESYHEMAYLDIVQQSMPKDPNAGFSKTLNDTLNHHHRWLNTLTERLSALPEKTLKPYPLEDMAATDWLEAVEQAVPSDLSVAIRTDAMLSKLWLRVDGPSLVSALISVMQQVRQQTEPPSIGLQALHEGAGVVVRMSVPDGFAINADLDADWLSLILHHAKVVGSPLGQTAAEVVAYHGGQWSLEDDGIVLRLPTISAPDVLPEALAQRHEGRPEHYDFHLFNVAIHDVSQKDQPLKTLAYTVFDTETTGLNPSGGDEIIQIGAVRIVNGRVLNKERFDQLVDPKRPIPASSTAIHGLAPKDVQGQPDIETVLPLFHRFCDGTVLVAHNADFDLQCLSLKAPMCGLEFDHPVLDTLLLSALAHPYQESHNLDEVAIRLGIELQDRHRALGDAKMTAEIFIRLLPILEARGIQTLGDALKAQRAVWQKRASY